MTNRALPIGSCSVSGCVRPLKQCGYCAMHYKRVWKTGDPGPVGELPRVGWAPPPKVCDVDGCDQLTRSHKAPYCGLHRRRAARGVEMSGPRLKTPNVGLCAVDGCGREAETKQMCKGHYSRQLRDGDHGPAEFFVPKFEPFIRDDGYRMAYDDGQWDLEHRIVMRKALGRELPPNTTVHHRNGDRLDNRPDNLELWSKAQPAGQRVEDKISFAIEILSMYPEVASRMGYVLFGGNRHRITVHDAEEYDRFCALN